MGDLLSNPADLQQRLHERTRQLEERTRELADRTAALEALTERTAAAESALAAASVDLERRNAELDELIYAASHDLEEPLRKVVMFSGALRKHLPAELPERAAKDMHYIEDAAGRMQALVRDLLELSRVGRGEVRRAPVPLEACASRALAALSERIAETGAQVTRAPLPVVQGDATLLAQLYQGLIGNALKFYRGGPPQVLLTAERNGDGRWVLGVRDAGIGIPAEYHEQVFQPFKRLHGRAEFPGSGIGLAICKRVVDALGGRIWIESGPEHGCHVKFTLGDAPEAA